ncbi:SDR family oxidoreductase [Chlorobium phaeovibrioides]|uniref:SDR family oxidoreductase n=1 Tax=Chlorobium phaeovibrioides TaxID=1094 RepID=A0A5M8IEK7_CHLPH|nr:SDR family oxidoreductase [Chlorobium phaeovibrioides]KAA6232842.1 SDR family oxidoreductase [Chlorobium phaeovibrioides]
MKQTIIITGAGKGIGRAIALDFSRAASLDPSFEPVLVLISRTASDLESLAAECASPGVQTECIEADIADTQSLGSLVEGIMGRHGTIDCLINNAGVGRFGPFTELTEEDYHYTMDINLKGTFFLTQKVFPIMEAQRSGHIFFITSVAAEKAYPSSSLYSMSKFAQKGLVEAMRLYAVKCGVRITNVMPGAAVTPMWGELDEATKSLMMMPEDISRPIVEAYLLPRRTSIEEIVIRPIGGDINE